MLAVLKGPSVLVVAIVLMLVLPAIAPASSDEVASARQFLTSHGLAPSGNVWITRREARLKRVAESLEALERRHQQAITRAEEALAANEAIRARLAQAEAVERASEGKPQATPQIPSATTSNTVPATASLTGKINSQMTDVTGTGEQTPLQQAMIELVNARTAVQLAVLAIYRDAPPVDAEYQTLKKDESIRAALKQINSSARLGPARNYPRDIARAEVIATNAFTTEIPGYLESGQFRVAAMLNDLQSVTFTLQMKDSPLLLAASVAERLGLTARDFAESPKEVDIAGRRLSARPVKLASLRIGAGYWKDVPALVLPPEAEDLGSQLSPGVLAGYEVSLQPRRMVAVLSVQQAPGK